MRAGDAEMLQARDPAALTRPVCEVEPGRDFFRLPFACHPICHCQQRGEIAQQFERLAVARAFEGLFVIVHGRDRGGVRVKVCLMAKKTPSGELEKPLGAGEELAKAGSLGSQRRANSLCRLIH